MLYRTIERYLESHKRLVIPQFGAFVVKTPGQCVLFTELLRRDDGVLRSLLREEGMNELEAAGEIDRFLFEVRHAVQGGREYVMEGFGLFRGGPNGTIAFEYRPAPSAQPVPESRPAAQPAAARGGDASEHPVREQAPHAGEGGSTRSAMPHVSPSAKMNPEPCLKGLRYGRPTKTTDAYSYVEPSEGRRIDRFLIVAIVAALLAIAAIAFGYYHNRQEALLDEEVEFALPDAALPADPAETPADDGAAVGAGTTDAPAVESPAQTDKKQ